VSYVSPVSVRFAVAFARPGTMASTFSFTWRTAICAPQITCFQEIPLRGTPTFVYGKIIPILADFPTTGPNHMPMRTRRSLDIIGK